MTRNDNKPKSPKRVGEPVQVYLTDSDQARLERLSVALRASKSDVLRRGLEALELQLMDPSAHPALRLIGMVADGDEAGPIDVACDHDRILTEHEEASWSARTAGSE